MVKVNYTKEQGLKQESGSASFEIPNDIVISHSINQTVKGNTASVIDFGVLVHGTAQLVNSVDLNGKYITFSSANGSLFYAWFNIDAGATDPQLGGTGIEVNGAAGNVDQVTEIASLLSLKLMANVQFAKEFHSTPNASTVTICAKRMGRSGSIVSLNDLASFEDNSGATFTVGLTTTHGEGSYLVNGLGLSLVGEASSSAGGAAFVVLKDLKQDANYGVRKIILSDHPEDVTIYGVDEITQIGSFDAEGDAVQAIWNGKIWKTIFNV
jgi:hypothetical protein